MTTWHVGTVGFGYKAWLGAFFPPALPTSAFLAHYAQHFGAVEIDTTFYGTPRAATVRGWATRAPDGFVFCPKTPRDISHSARLATQHAAMAQFVAAMQTLGGKLGPILIQFPPSLTIAALDDLRDFLSVLPDGARYALEFRDPSWRTAAVFDLLRHHNVTWVSADYIHLPPEIHVTADFLYLRFIGEHGAFDSKDREQLDRSARLQMWLQQIAAAPATAHGYAFFNNDYSGHSPATANRFKTLLGQPTTYPQIGVQPRLF